MFVLSLASETETVPPVRADAARTADPAYERCVWETDRKLLGAIKDGATEIGDFPACATSVQPEAKSPLRTFLETMTAGYPIHAMVPEISTFDREIAALIVGIAKKESDWGKRTPKQNGEECYNYWGYRAPGSRGVTADGYACFASPEEGARTIGERLRKLSELRLSTEPHRMIVWKCGSSCAGHSDESVKKWISDVDHYYRKIVAIL